MKNPYKIGTRVHVDTDNKEWGRVASDATVLKVGYKTLFLNVDSIRANIFARKKDCSVNL